jgi:omega-amidase
MDDLLKITIFQYDIAWLDINQNLSKIEQLCKDMEVSTDIIFLPEMFATGFTVSPNELHCELQEKVLSKLIELSNNYKCAITGSHPFCENGIYYNRLVFVTPDGNIQSYDKRHLFSIGEENQKYKAGNNRIVFSYKDWRLMPQICYDLRFPVWSRNDLNYDILYYSANWPSVRNYAWEILLKARAIENQSYVIGANRIGKDGRKINYIGNSQAISMNGEIIEQAGKYEKIMNVSLNKELLNRFRQSFPVLNDRDSFTLEV